MAPHVFVICSFVLTFGIPMAFAIREYWTLGVSPGHLPPGETVEPVPSPLPDAGVKPLPDCLIPRPVQVRVRELA